MEEYRHFIHQKVRVITTGRLTDESHYNVGNSLQLEGILDKETETQIFLENMKTFEESDGQFEVDSPYGAISKDKIISMYEAPN